MPYCDAKQRQYRPSKSPKMKSQKVTEYILSQIGLKGCRAKTNIAGWTQAEIAALPAGTPTVVSYGCAGRVLDMSMPVADVLAAGYSVSDIARSIKETAETSPSILVRRNRALTAEELAKHRSNYISPEAAAEYWPTNQIVQCAVGIGDLRPDDVVIVHYTHIG